MDKHTHCKKEEQIRLMKLRFAFYLVFMILVFTIIIMAIIYNEDTVIKEIFKAIGYAFTGGTSGYLLSKSKGK